MSEDRDNAGAFGATVRRKKVQLSWRGLIHEMGVSAVQAIVVVLALASLLGEHIQGALRHRRD